MLTLAHLVPSKERCEFRTQRGGRMDNAAQIRERMPALGPLGAGCMDFGGPAA